MFDIITFGSATEDIMVKPKNLTALQYKKGEDGKELCLPVGSKVDVDSIAFNSGGGGTNTAATFALQGFKTAYCGTIGSDLPGNGIINELKKLKINTNFILRTSKKPTNHSIIIVGGSLPAGEAGDRTILAYRGAAELMGKNDIPWRKLKAKWLYLAPLSGLLCQNFEELVNFAFTKKMKIAVNPGMAELALPNFKEIAKKIDVLFVNQEEASFLTKIPFENEKEIFSALCSVGAKVTVMTQGAKGVMVRDGNSSYSAVPPVDRNVVDTTGAGDSFASGFLSEFMKSGDIEASIQLGMGNSVGCLSQIGAKNGLLKKGQEFEKVMVNKESL